MIIAMLARLFRRRRRSREHYPARPRGRLSVGQLMQIGDFNRGPDWSERSYR